MEITGGEASVEPTPTVNGAGRYEPPSSLPKFIKDAKPSTAMLICGKFFCSGWVMDTATPPSIRPDREFTFDPDESSLAVTFEQVIESCAKNPDKTFKAFIGGEKAER